MTSLHFAVSGTRPGLTSVPFKWMIWLAESKLFISLSMKDTHKIVRSILSMTFSIIFSNLTSLKKCLHIVHEQTINKQLNDVQHSYYKCYLLIINRFIKYVYFIVTDIIEYTSITLYGHWGQCTHQQMDGGKIVPLLIKCAKIHRNTLVCMHARSRVVFMNVWCNTYYRECANSSSTNLLGALECIYQLGVLFVLNK